MPVCLSEGMSNSKVSGGVVGMHVALGLVSGIHVQYVRVLRVRTGSTIKLQ